VFYSARVLIKGYGIDLHHRLGVYDNPSSLGMRARPRFPPQQPLHHSALPAGGCEARKQASNRLLPSATTRILFPFSHTSSVDVASLAKEWLFYEESGARLRMAHRCIEWDGWEEGLVESILGPEDQEDDWFKEWEEPKYG
jgi:hypothetical protein